MPLGTSIRLKSHTQWSRACRHQLLLVFFWSITYCYQWNVESFRSWAYTHIIYLQKLYESESEVTQSCLTLCDPMDCSPPGFSVHGIFPARILEWIAVSFFRGSSQPRNRTRVSCIAGGFFTDWAMREARPPIGDPNRQLNTTAWSSGDRLELKIWSLDLMVEALFIFHLDYCPRIVTGLPVCSFLMSNLFSSSCPEWPFLTCKMNHVILLETLQ